MTQDPRPKEQPAPTAAHDETAEAADAIDDLSPRSRWPRRIALLALAALIGVAAAFGTRFGTDPAVVDSPLIGRPAPDVTLPYLERDGELSLADLRGQVVVVNFWASWCVPCREEHADLVTAAQRYRDRDVTFVGIVYQDQPDQAIAFLDELGRGYDHLTDPRSRAAIDFGVFGVPETFFVDPQGTVVAKVVGKSDLALLSSTVETILAGGDPASVSRDGYERQP
jgi:cytochrome c biogenesis protein CcmG/thiol:disulfide interchange protein DsbE